MAIAMVETTTLRPVAMTVGIAAKVPAKMLHMLVVAAAMTAEAITTAGGGGQIRPYLCGGEELEGGGGEVMERGGGRPTLHLPTLKSLGLRHRAIPGGLCFHIPTLKSRPGAQSLRSMVSLKPSSTQLVAGSAYVLAGCFHSYPVR